VSNLIVLSMKLKLAGV